MYFRYGSNRKNITALTVMVASKNSLSCKVNSDKKMLWFNL